MDSESKKDPYRNKERFAQKRRRIENGVEGVSEKNLSLMIRYLDDMECGLNIATGSKKGSRSYIRLNVITERMIGLSKMFKKFYNIDCLTDITEEIIFKFFRDMRSGIIRRKDGKMYLSPRNFVKDFKAFWHWWMKINKKEGIIIDDITLDLDTSMPKPKWVYLTEDEVKLLANSAKYDYKILIWFLYDTGIRAPTELMNIKVSDFYNDFKELEIRNEISKTFGRRIKLMLCSQLIKEYVNSMELKDNDFLFTKRYYSMNAYMKALGKRVLGEQKSPAGELYSKLTMYDFRHCSCCYWLPRYKSESALKYRFGWKKSDKIHYYSELLGMRDTIMQDDLLLDVTKAELEKRMDKMSKEYDMIKEENKIMQQQMKVLKEVTARIYEKIRYSVEV